jgi:beta-N-acetylhexosaminidase
MPMGIDVPKYVSEIPTAFISVDNPYHLQDVPRVKTFINGYTSNEHVVDAIVDKLLGKSPFTGINPVDPFCGLWDAHL